jgi:hypothetical protein
MDSELPQALLATGRWAFALLHSVSLAALTKRFCHLATIYEIVDERRIQLEHAPLSINCSQVYDEFECACRYFLDDRDVN